MRWSSRRQKKKRYDLVCAENCNDKITGADIDCAEKVCTGIGCTSIPHAVRKAHKRPRRNDGTEAWVNPQKQTCYASSWSTIVDSIRPDKNVHVSICSIPYY